MQEIIEIEEVKEITIENPKKIKEPFETKTTKELMHMIIEREGWDNKTTYAEFKAILKR